jgi:hypothetical protein
LNLGNAAKFAGFIALISGRPWRESCFDFISLKKLEKLMRSKDTAVCGQAQESLEQNVCARCDRRRLCGHLAEALAILKTQPSVLVDLHQVRARNALQKRLDFYEYSYPMSLEFCQFSRISANEARQILFRARDLSVSWTEMETPECYHGD